MPKKTINTKLVLEADTYNIDGELKGKTSLPEEVFGQDVNHKLIAQYIYVYLQNQRSGTRSSKTRGDVIGSTRKIYRQKGTGRARHGDIKAPVFIGGGVAHGPKPYQYNKKISKKMRKQVLFQVLSQKCKEGKIKILKDIESITGKTKEFANLLKKMKISGAKGKQEKTMIIIPKNAHNIDRAGRNIRLVTLRTSQVVNPYDVLSNINLLITKKALEEFLAHFLPSDKNDSKDNAEDKKAVKNLRVKKSVEKKKTVKKQVKTKK